jgi:hypothetical protein
MIAMTAQSIGAAVRDGTPPALAGVIERRREAPAAGASDRAE